MGITAGREQGTRHHEEDGEEEREQEDGSRSSLIVYSEPLSTGMQSLLLLLASARKLTFNLKQRPPYIRCDYTFTVIVHAAAAAVIRNKRRVGRGSRRRQGIACRGARAGPRNNPLADCSCQIM